VPQLFDVIIRYLVRISLSAEADSGSCSLFYWKYGNSVLPGELAGRA